MKNKAITPNETAALKNVKKPVLFEFFAPQAERVQLAGTFNGWNPALTPLRKNKEGFWKVSLELERGRYEYRYWVDGSWQNDQNPVECVPNAFGTWNCVIEVS